MLVLLALRHLTGRGPGAILGCSFRKFTLEDVEALLKLDNLEQVNDRCKPLQLFPDDCAAALSVEDAGGTGTATFRGGCEPCMSGAFRSPPSCVDCNP